VARENEDFYRDYYGDEALGRWRQAGARDKALHISELCGRIAPNTVLEVGCGDGSVLAELSRLGFGEQLFGIELSASGVEVARSRNIARVHSIETFDGRRIPFADGSFDLVYATHVLEHVAHERLFLAELARVGRHVFVEVPLEDTMRVANAVLNDIGHINFYNRVTFQALLEEFLEVDGFEVFDHSREVLAMAPSRAPVSVRALLRSAGLTLVPALAQSLFVYHAAALGRPRG
jgi:SAM-dependent methyltransferase